MRSGKLPKAMAFFRLSKVGKAMPNISNVKFGNNYDPVPRANAKIDHRLEDNLSISKKCCNGERCSPMRSVPSAPPRNPARLHSP